MAYTTTNLLSSIERKSFSPSNQTTFTTSEILELCDEILKADILPAILNVREEFFVTYKDYSITANQSAYDIPARAVGMIAREVQLIDDGNNVIDLGRIEPERLETTEASGNAPEYFYLRGNQIIVYPTPSTTAHTLRVYYFLRPGELVQVSASATVSAINTSTNVVTVTSIPSTWVTGDIFDFVKKDGGHEYRGIEFTSSDITGTNITFSSLPSDLAVGDYIAVTGTSPLIQLPPDFQPVLATLVAAEMLLSMNQPDGEKMREKGLKMLETAQRLITPRIQGESQVIIPDWL